MKRNRLQKKEPKKKKSILVKIILWLTGLAFLGAVCAGIFAIILYKHYDEELPPIFTLKDYRPPLITTVYSDDDRMIAEFFKERRIIARLDEMPPLLIQAFVDAEDSRFYEHKGVDFISIARAAIKNIETGAMSQGGSTITQQVIKSFLLTPEKKFERKIKEAILAHRLNMVFSKQEILYLYLNQIYLGHGAYGVGAASENYFGKPVKELGLAECAMLAGLPKAPSGYSPFKHFDKAKIRQKYVLNRMVEEGHITPEEAEKAYKTELNIQPRKNLYLEKVPYFTEHVRKFVEQEYGTEALYTEGYKIFTTVNIEMQKSAQAAIRKGLRELDNRHSRYRGPEKHLAPEEIPDIIEGHKKSLEGIDLEPDDVVQGVVLHVNIEAKRVQVNLGTEQGNIPFETLKWAEKKTGEKDKRPLEKILETGDLIWVHLIEKSEDGLWDLRLDQIPEAQAALLCLETGTGHVKVMVGGRDFKTNQFNRATQSRRQPGSAFKPVIYAAALDKGYTPASTIIDNVFIYQDHNMVWKPRNYDKKIHGRVLLRDAITHSRNLSTINILDKIGVDYAINYARKLGITSDLTPNLSLALGSSGVSLIELVKVYSVFANDGYLIEPVFISRITDRDGMTIYERDLNNEKVIEETTAYLMTSLLESVISEGTARNLRVLGRPAAGKTGTTNDLHDAWFVGYTPDYVAGVWVGHDDQQKELGSKETGGRAASPIWLYFMEDILQDKPVKVFKAPKGIVFSKIDAETGLLPVPESQKTIFECFKEGTAPTQYSQRSDSVSNQDQFFKTDM
jgi:penicillin-binding protein 1A